MTPRKFSRAAILALLLAAGASGCAASDGFPPAETGYARQGIEASSDSAKSQEASPLAATDEASPAEPSPAVAPVVIVTGQLDIDVKDPRSALEAASGIVTGAGGSVATTEFSAYADAPTAYATLKIPADAFDRVLDEIKKLGDVTTESTSATDVGAEVADLDARASALETSIGRLSELMKTAQYTADLLEAERELTSRQAELDDLNAQRAWYADRVAFSTLDLRLRSTSALPSVTESIWERSWNTFLDGIDVIAFILIMILPWLLLLVPLGVLIWFLVRRSRKRRAEKRAVAHAHTLDAQAAPESADPIGDQP